MRILFGECAIDVERRELRRSGKLVRVEPQVFDLILVGSEEVLLSDALMVAARAGVAGVECTLVIAPEMIHVWHAFYPLLAAARTAIASAGLWIKAKTGE